MAAEVETCCKVRNWSLVVEFYTSIACVQCSCLPVPSCLLSIRQLRSAPLRKGDELLSCHSDQLSSFLFSCTSSLLSTWQAVVRE